MDPSMVTATSDIGTATSEIGSRVFWGQVPEDAYVSEGKGTGYGVRGTGYGVRGKGYGVTG